MSTCSDREGALAENFHPASSPRPLLDEEVSVLESRGADSLSEGCPGRSDQCYVVCGTSRDESENTLDSSQPRTVEVVNFESQAPKMYSFFLYQFDLSPTG